MNRSSERSKEVCKVFYFGCRSVIFISGGEGEKLNVAFPIFFIVVDFINRATWLKVVLKQPIWTVTLTVFGMTCIRGSLNPFGILT